MARKPTRTVYDDVADWVAAGDPGRILKDLVERGFYHENKSQTLQQVDAALAVAGEHSVANMIDVIFREMLGFSASLLYRAQYMARMKLQKLDEQINGGHHIDVTELNGQILPTMQKLQQHLISVAKAYGTTRHMVEISNRDASIAEPTAMRIARDTDLGAIGHLEAPGPLGPLPMGVASHVA